MKMFYVKIHNDDAWVEQHLYWLRGNLLRRYYEITVVISTLKKKRVSKSKYVHWLRMYERSTELVYKVRLG